MHVPFQEVSKEEFVRLKKNCERRRSLIYRTTDIELADGNSEVTFYSLSYIERSLRTRYFVSRSVFVVPPSNFLGDSEEERILQWLIKDKVSFFRQQSSHVRKLSRKPATTLEPLTEYEKEEVEECSKLFEQLQDVETMADDKDSVTELELPNFSLDLDFRSYCS